MIKALLTSLIILLILSQYSLAETDQGHIAFFFIGPIVTQEDYDAYDDFSFYYNKSHIDLESGGLSTSLHESEPLQIKINDSSQLVFNKDQLESDVGYVLVKANGSNKILFGVHTDVDLYFEIEEFFK